MCTCMCQRCTISKFHTHTCSNRLRIDIPLLSCVCSSALTSESRRSLSYSWHAQKHIPMDCIVVNRLLCRFLRYKKNICDHKPLIRSTESLLIGVDHKTHVIKKKNIVHVSLCDNCHKCNFEVMWSLSVCNVDLTFSNRSKPWFIANSSISYPLEAIAVQLIWNVS